MWYDPRPEMFERTPSVVVLVVVGWLGVGSAGSAQLPEYTLFEAGQVRPVAMSPDGTKLFAVNTPNATLEIFDVGDEMLSFAAAVPVGLEPIAVAALDDTEVWVVNHLSDSVSIVDVAADPPRVVRTLLVGDEPRDIVFAGSDGRRAFIRGLPAWDWFIYPKITNWQKSYWTN